MVTYLAEWLTTGETSTVGDHVFLADYDDQGLIRHVGSHLACFAAGNWLLGNFIMIALFAVTSFIGQAEK
jgi:hypothetical protein